MLVAIALILAFVGFRELLRWALPFDPIPLPNVEPAEDERGDAWQATPRISW